MRRNSAVAQCVGHPTGTIFIHDGQITGPFGAGAPPGGTGKTRLALAAARSARESFPAGVCWVELAQIEDPGIVGPTVASRLGVPDTPGQDPAEAIAEFVAEHQVRAAAPSG